MNEACNHVEAMVMGKDMWAAHNAHANGWLRVQSAHKNHRCCREHLHGLTLSRGQTHIVVSINAARSHIH